MNRGVALGLVSLSLLVSDACKPQEPVPSSTTLGAGINSDWVTFAEDAAEGTRWRTQRRSDTSGTCLRFLVLPNSTPSELPSIQASSCLSLEEGEQLLNYSVGIVPDTKIGFLFGLATPALDAVTAEFNDGSTVETTLEEGVYVLVFHQNMVPVSLKGTSKSQVVAHCTFLGDIDPC